MLRWKVSTKTVRPDSFVSNLLPCPGHKFLCDQGILHRDISAGNILLRDSQNPLPGHEGFITDFEFASLNHGFERREIVEKVPSTPRYNDRGALLYTMPPTTRQRVHFSSTDAPQGHQMIVSVPFVMDKLHTHPRVADQGTLQFMALELLRAIRDKKTVQHTVSHDIESFVWVFMYCLWRKLAVRYPTKADDIATRFRQCYGEMDLYKTIRARSMGLPFDIVQDEDIEPMTRTVVSEPVTDFCALYSFTVLERKFNSLRSGVLNGPTSGKYPEFTYDSLAKTCDMILSDLINSAGA